MPTFKCRVLCSQSYGNSDPFFLSFSAKQLEDFDQYCVSLSAQCEDNTGLPLVPRVTDVVPVRDENKRGAWVRARITRILPDRYDLC